jgi:predicted ArsR family transcriptional regulator
MSARPDPLTPPRLRVLAAVRQGKRTVNELAGALGVTDNAVRGHLESLARAGYVRDAGVVRSGLAGKPAAEYEVTADAEVMLSRAYAPALAALVSALSRQLEPRALRAALREAGRSLVPAPKRPASLAASATAARALLAELGGSAHVLRSKAHADLLGDGCPLAAAVAREPATCTIVESMIEARTGRHVEQRCAHGERPRCAFRISTPN